MTNLQRLSRKFSRSVLTLFTTLCLSQSLLWTSCAHAYDTTCCKKGSTSAYSINIKGPFVAEHEGYTVCYDAQTLNPIWVYEYLTDADLHAAKIKKPPVRKSGKNFNIDKKVPRRFQARHSDYTNSKFVRGHMAACANHKDTQPHMDETFLMTNISPQVGTHFNTGGGWFKLEEQVRDWVENDGYSAHVIMGPLYLPDDSTNPPKVSYPIISNRKIAVPTHFFKVIFLEDARGVLTHKAYVLPNRAFQSGESFKDFAKTLEDIEILAGLALTPVHR